VNLLDRIPERAVELGPAVALTVLLQLELALADPASLQAPPALNALAGLAATLPLVLRRRLPLAGVLATLAAIVAGELLGSDLTENAIGAMLALLASVYSLGRHGGRRAAAAGLGAVVGLLNTMLALEGAVAADFLIVTFLFGAGPWAAGRVLQVRQRQAASLEDMTIQLEREQERRAEHAVTGERARIARELHDVIAHSVSVMVVQAGAARRVAASDPERVEAALATIEESGRSTLVEMRRLLGLLRSYDEGGDRAPQPGMESLEELVERTRRAGLPVELEVSGRSRPLPPGVDLSAYRIVQEALTNALKHAGDARAGVRVTYGPRRLDLHVFDDGQGPSPQSNGSEGHGLIGMEQRVSLYGGTLHTGPREGGGYEVRAALPLPAPGAPA